MKDLTPLTQLKESPAILVELFPVQQSISLGDTSGRHQGQVFHLADNTYAPPNTNSINSTSAGTQNERPDPTHML